jgi:soluble lytic murein transglycosylase-like protein
MTETTFNRQTAHMHDRTHRLALRLKMALASIGVICALFVISLASFHGVAAAATAKASNSSTSANYGYTGYRAIAYKAAVKARISPRLFINQIEAESNFNPYAVSGAGAVGIAQFMPATAASMGVNPYNPTQALYGAARLMASLKSEFGGNYAKALAAYNAGPGAVEYAVSAGGSNWRAYLPYETKNYIIRIMG